MKSIVVQFRVPMDQAVKWRQVAGAVGLSAWCRTVCEEAAGRAGQGAAAEAVVQPETAPESVTVWPPPPFE